MKGFVLGLPVEGRKLWRRLSVAQRVSFIGISAAVALGLTWMALEARAPGVRHLISAETLGGEARLQDLRVRLEAKGILCRESVDPEGQLGIQVASDDLDAARRMLPSDLRSDRESGDLSRTDAREDDAWLFEGNGFFGSQYLYRLRLEASKRRRVQKSISWSVSIQRAGLEIDKPAQSPLRTHRTDGSATVTLYLASGVERLTAREAGRVRRIVRGAYGLLPEAVTLTDNMGNSYGVDEDDVQPDEDDDRYCAHLENDIGELISGLFAADEFKLVVRAFQPRPGTGSGANAGSAVGGLLAGGSFERIDLSSPREAPGAEAPDGPARPRSAQGAGEERGAIVVVNFDLDAVRRVLNTDGGSFRNIEEFRAGQKQAIENLVFPHPSHVSVFVHPLTRPEPLVAGVSGSRPGPTTAPEGKWGVWQAWLERRPFLATVSAVLVVLLIGGVAVSRRWASSGRGSSLRGDGAARLSPPGKVAKSNVGTAGHIPWRVFAGRAAARDDLLTGTNGQDSLLSATDRMSEWVQERPQTAASVLRVWLAQPSPLPGAEVSRDGGPS